MSRLNDVFVQTLPNGLTVLLQEAHDAPLASFWIWYRVGSRDEHPGLTGISHWVEHMQFKGTPSLAKGAIFRDVSKHGGTLNAMTSNDWTAYYETLPADRLDLSLQIEADRMANSLFDPAETESERTVILSERQGAENTPTFLLYEEVVGAAFRAHPYRHMVIGHEPDLRTISRDDLYDHYRRYYTPTNAIVVAVGDFDTAELHARIEAAFGPIEQGPSITHRQALEPAQRGERRVTLRRPAPTSYLRMAFHAPNARHPDTPALLLADAVLSGGKGMGLGGGGPMGRSARFYRALVAAGLARSASSDFDLYVDPFLFTVGVTALPGVEPSRIEAVVDAELARLRDEATSESELARALKQLKAQYVYSGEGVTNRAFWLGQMEMVDSYRRVASLIDELEAVTADDVQRVAQTYLRPETRTVGWLVPDGEGGGTSDERDVEAAAIQRLWFFNPSSAKASSTESRRAPFERRELANGTVVLGQARPDDPSVFVRLRLSAGALLDSDARSGLAAFTARMLSRGTSTRSFAQFNEETDGLGATIGFETGRLFVDVAVRCLREDLPILLDLAADVLRNPAFPEEEIEKVRQEMLTAIREQDNDTRSSADRVLRRLIYPVGHPYARRTGGERETVSAIDRDDLLAFHRVHYGSSAMVAGVVGGVPDIDSVVALISDRFAGWNTDPVPAQSPVPPPVPTTSLHERVAIAGKSQADVAIGFPVPGRSDPDYYALDMANLILGRLGLMGRLGASVRDRQGLAYYAFSQIEPGREGSIWISRAGVDPSNVEQALASINAEVRGLREGGVTDEELADAKSYLTGVLPLALETNDGVAATLLNIEHYGLGLDYLDRYPAIINGMDAAEVQRTAQEHLDPDRLAAGIAGPPEGD